MPAYASMLPPCDHAQNYASIIHQCLEFSYWSSEVISICSDYPLHIPHKNTPTVPLQHQS